MSDCIFCKIVSGEFGSATIYENDEFKVILDRFPANEGHVPISLKSTLIKPADCSVWQLSSPEK